MREKILKKLGKRGFVFVGLLMLVGIACLFAVDVQAGLAALSVPFVFGMASATGFDSLARLYTGKYTHSAAVESGDIIVGNSCVLASVNNTAINTEGVYIYQGKLILPKEAPLVINFLDPVFWDSAAGKITKTAAGNTPCGFCAEGALSADTTIVVYLKPNLEYIAANEIGPNAVTPIKMGTRAAVALADAAAAPTIAQLMTSSIFAMTPTAARTFTTPTAAVMVAGISGATVGTWFDFIVVNLGNFPITLTAGDAGVTLSGNAVINKGSATFRALLTNVTGAAEALTIYRTDGAVVAENIPIADAKMLIGDVNGQAAAKTPSGVVSMTREGVFSLTSAGSPLANEIADPGTGQAIPITASGVIPITTAAAETNTLAAPSAIGMILVLTCNVYAVGDRVVTCATTVNQTGNNTLTFGAAGDTIMLYSTKIGGALRWRIAGNDGVALSTV